MITNKFVLRMVLAGNAIVLGLLAFIFWAITR